MDAGGDADASHGGVAHEQSGSQGWRNRVLLGTSTAAGIGATIGLIGGIMKDLPLKAFAVPVTTNFVICGAALCGMTEITREILRTEPGSPLNTIGGGLISGTMLSRIQGQARPLQMGILFAVVGTSAQLAATEWKAYKLRRFINSLPEEELPQELREQRHEKKRQIKWPEWLPIRKVTDEEYERRIEVQRRLREAYRNDALENTEEE